MDAQPRVREMPAGVTWGRYLTTLSISLLTMLSGAQCVHLYYRPLEDFDELIEARKKELREQMRQSESIDKEDLGS
ncbi:BWNIN-like protein [Mya arenaria]|uniref:BWNIN-like protein n=1 Tax=Mya arenaria TaxID=6604 RepID=A0ABY7FW72_MYAAR|nr:BWNIN-like protein [Mya arenaria]